MMTAANAASAPITQSRRATRRKARRVPNGRAVTPLPPVGERPAAWASWIRTAVLAPCARYAALVQRAKLERAPGRALVRLGKPRRMRRAKVRRWLHALRPAPGALARWLLH